MYHTNSNERITCHYVDKDYVCCATENGMCYIWSKEFEEPIFSKSFESPVHSILTTYIDSYLFLIIGSDSKLKIISLKKLDNTRLEVNNIKTIEAMGENISLLAFDNMVIYATSKSGVNSYNIETNIKNEPTASTINDFTEIGKLLIKNEQWIELFNNNNTVYGLIRSSKA